MRMEKQSNEGPRPQARGAGAATKEEGSQSLELTSKPDDWKAAFYLHVEDDGTELRFTHEPRCVLTLRVEVIEVEPGVWVQETRTRTLEFWWDAGGKLIEPRPRGVGWELHDNRSDKFSVWRRPHFAEVRP